MKDTRNTGKEFLIITSALATAAATTAAGIAYFLNEEKVNKASDKLAEKTTAMTEKVFSKIKEFTDDLMYMAEEEPASEAEVSVEETVVSEEAQVSEEDPIPEVMGEPELVNEDEDESENPEP